MSLFFLHPEDAGWYVLLATLPLILTIGILLRRERSRDR